MFMFIGFFLARLKSSGQEGLGEVLSLDLVMGVGYSPLIQARGDLELLPLSGTRNSGCEMLGDASRLFGFMSIQDLAARNHESHDSQERAKSSSPNLFSACFDLFP